MVNRSQAVATANAIALNSKNDSPHATLGLAGLPGPGPRACATPPPGEGGIWEMKRRSVRLPKKLAANPAGTSSVHAGTRS
jgi:hypothetical protein